MDLDYYTVNLFEFDGEKRFAPTSENPEQYVKNYFEKYVNYTQKQEYDMSKVQVFEKEVQNSQVEIGDWYVVKTKEGEKEIHQLYFVNKKVEGWVMSSEVAKHELKKTATFETVHLIGSEFVKSEVEMTISEKEKEKRETRATIKELLNNVEFTNGRENKIEEARKFFNYLRNEDSAKRLMKNHHRFKETVRNKLLEFIFIEKISEAEQWYFDLFKIHILKNVTRHC